jgi:hypothetical protein
VDALNLTHSPENGTVWETADRVDLRASHASVHARGKWLTSPRGLRPHRVEQREWNIPGVQRRSWAKTSRVCIRNVTGVVHMGSLERDGTWYSDEAAHPRGVQGPAYNRP